MSTLTSLISAGGAGGGGETNIITDPLKFNRVIIQGGSVSGLSQWTNPTTTSSNSSDFWTATGFGAFIAATDFISQVAVAASDTYVTLLDTSNANGGYLYWILGCGGALGGNNSTYIKITIDGGDPVEFQLTPAANGVFRQFLGSGLSNTAVPTISTAGSNYDVFNSYVGGLYALGASQENFSQGYQATNASYFPRLTADINLLDSMSFQKLYFSASLKIEVKQLTLYTSSISQRAACLYRLL